MEHKIIQVLRRFGLKRTEHNKVKQASEEGNAIKQAIELLLKLQLEERNAKFEYLSEVNKSLTEQRERLKVHLEQLEGATTEAEAETPHKSRMELQERRESYIQ